MTALGLDALQALADAATPAPWTAHPDGLVWSKQIGDPVSGSVRVEDAQFIAAVRNALPALLARAAADAQLRTLLAGRDRAALGHHREIDRLRIHIAGLEHQLAAITQPLTEPTDRALLRAARRWALDNGWELLGQGWANAPYLHHATILVDWHEDELTVRRRPIADGPWLLGWFTSSRERFPVTSVRQAVDLLVALEILPAHLSTAYRVAVAERPAVAPAEMDPLRAELEDQRAARRTAAESADRFRDVLAEALGHVDSNPGDDVLVAELRARFGLTGPEPTRWRDLVTGYQAVIDQLNAEHRAAEGHRLGGYDANPTIDMRDPATSYRAYADRLDADHPRWWRDPLDRMAPGLAEQARVRLAADPLDTEPGPEVTTVYDREGARWVRRSGGWCYEGWCYEGQDWPSLVDEYGPITAVRPTAGGTGE